MDREKLKGLHAIERATGSEIDHSDMAFLTSHLPDIPIRNRIVAICGISDLRHSASPKVDGWFLSDFWLFYHLLHPVCTRSTNQIWLTCEDPRSLVEKYGEYAHGDPRGDRRVVLEKDMLPWIEEARNVRVVHREVLKDRFIGTVQEQALLARAHQETLILLILGHGDAKTYGVYLGGKALMDKNATLKTSEIQQVLPNKANVTLLMTSCFSGGWLVQPKLSSSHLNVTGLAAAGPKSETHSWALTRSAGRACGSTIASAIVNNMIEVEAEEADDPRDHPTYVGLVDSIYRKASSLNGVISDQNVHFSAQDDDWECNWSKRTGVPLTRFRDRWEMLKQVPPGATKDASSGTASNRRVGALQCELMLRANEYFAARPGRDSLASNVGLHGNLCSFLEGDLLSGDQGDQLRWILDRVVYRLSLMHEADEYVAAMGISFPSCLGYSVDEYMPAPAKQTIQQQAFCHLWRNPLFDPPPQALLPDFRKPVLFLSIVLAETCSAEQVVTKVEKAQLFKKRKLEMLLPQVRAPVILNDATVIEKREIFRAAMTRLGRKINIKGLSMSSARRD